MESKIYYSNCGYDFRNNLEGYLKNNTYSSIFVLVDENTKEHCLPYLDFLDNFNLIEIVSGENNKNLKTCEFIWQELLNKNADRSALLINLGGGVLCDIGSFCASVYKRGIDFINIATTVLSQVDASIGGKTGINFNNYKNIIGSFSSYRACFIDYRFFSTLSIREIKNGFAEILKHGFILDRDYLYYCLEELEKLSFKDINYDKIIKKSIELKDFVVRCDFKEKNLRKILNFGHSISHALEAYSNLYHKDNILKHGEAVIIGMICALKMSNSLDNKEREKIIQRIKNIYPKELFHHKDWDIEKMLEFMKNDKKNKNSKYLFVLLDKIGKASFDNIIEECDIRNILKEVLF